MHNNQALITRFYEAFSERDHAGMAACYHADIHFEDPAFPDLNGPEAAGMWRMLCERGADLQLTFSQVTADDDGGAAHWEATYTFSATGRKVHNKIDARFKFKDGLIVEHIDSFDFWAWSKMALGAPGYLLGWTSFLRGKVQSQAGSQLKKIMAKWETEGGKAT